MVKYMLLASHIIKIIIFTALSVIFYSLIDFIFSKLNKRIYEAMGKTSNINANKYINLYKHIPKKIINNKNTKIKASILNTNIPTYYFLKIMLCIICMYILKIKNYSYVVIMTGGVLGYTLLDIITKILISKENKYIRFIISDIYDMLNCQTAAGVQLGQALVEIYDIVENKRFKNALIEMAAEINLTKDIIPAVEKLDQKFKSKELSMFCMIIKQSIKTGKSKKSINSLSKISRMSNISEINQQNNSIAQQLALITFLIFLNMIVLIMYSFSNQIFKSISEIFITH